VDIVIRTLVNTSSWAIPLKIRLSTKDTKKHEEKTFVNLRVLRGYCHPNAGEHQFMGNSFENTFIH